MDPKTPACVIENGTLKNQREQVTTLDGLTSKGFAPPALVVIGDVVRFAKSREMAMTAKAA